MKVFVLYIFQKGGKAISFRRLIYMLNEIFFNPIAITFILLVLLGILIVVYSVIRSINQKHANILEKIGGNKKLHTVGVIDQILNKISFIVESEKKLDKKIAVLDVKYTARTLTKLELVGILLGIVLSFHFRNFLMVFPLCIICAYIPTTYVKAKVNKRLNLFDDQVLDAFQVFITDYTTTKSIQKTLTNICPKLKYPLRREFELLGRNLNSGKNIEQCFINFAERTQNKWITIFSQLTILYFRNGGDIVPHLLDVTKSITNERIIEETNQTELSSLRTVNLVMNALIPVVYISNQYINPENAKVFVNTPTGKVMMLAVAVCCLISLYLGEKITEA
ncbi:MAG: hypothetical protein PHN69_05920 [Candidatus Pacebacteria bacterium]|nr:hypothetical protein [Candidatus Paceibacterota bacterium]